MPSETPARETFDITGMTCAACQSRVQKVASETKGVTNASVNLLKNSMELTYDGDPATIAAVVKAIDRAGYGAEPRSTATSTAKAGRATTALEIGRHTSELQSLIDLVCRLLLEKKKTKVFAPALIQIL